jgi:choline dehydrogenase-like flavoprotein
VLSQALQRSARQADDELLNLSLSYDAIVIGGGAAGGVACDRLTAQGLKVLLLDAGWTAGPVSGVINAGVAGLTHFIRQPAVSGAVPPPVMQLGHKALKAIGRLRQPVQSKCYAWPLAPGALVDDRDCPYTAAPGTAFQWYRSRQLGGRMIVPGHGRQYFRLDAATLSAEAQPGAAWPVGAGGLDADYADIEASLGLSGGDDHNKWVPASSLATITAPNAAEADSLARLAGRWPGCDPVLGRHASPVNFIEKAAASGRLRCRRGAVVRRINVSAQGEVTGAEWFDRQTGRLLRARAKIVFACASALETTRLLLASADARRAPGIGMQSDALGRYLMDHVVVGAGGVAPAQPSDTDPQAGRCVYVPRFDRHAGTNAGKFGVQIHRDGLCVGGAMVSLISFAEMLPEATNRVTLHPTRCDRFGMPVLQIDCRFSPAQLALAEVQRAAIADIAGALGVNLTRRDMAPGPPGSAIHECGTARMGTDPATSVVDPDNQCWDAKGLYVTDGACFPAQGTQNPTLTIMALTARAARHAARAVAVDDAAEATRRFAGQRGA